MASIEKIKEFSSLGREIGFTGSELNSFVSSRCEEYERERERERERDERERERDERERE